MVFYVYAYVYRISDWKIFNAKGIIHPFIERHRGILERVYMVLPTKLNQGKEVQDFFLGFFRNGQANGVKREGRKITSGKKNIK